MTTFDVAVVGAGPAGIAAAMSAAGLGTNVILISERPDEHGQLRAELASRGAGLIPNAFVWGAWPGFELALRTPGGAQLVRARSVILATGSTAVVRSFPGSDLPGVMTGQGLLRMLQVSGVWPGGKRVALIGDDAEMIEQVVVAVDEAGGEVVALIDADPFAEPSRGVLGAVGQRGEDARTEVDIAALCCGRQPDIALALMLDCGTGYAESLGGFVPVRSQTMETTVPGVYICGDCAGTGSVDAARIEGALAGAAAAELLGHAGGDAVMAARAQYERDAPERVSAAGAVLATWQQHRIESVRAGR